MAKQHEQVRSLKIRRQPSTPVEPTVTVEMVERLIEAKTLDLQAQVDRLQSNANVIAGIVSSMKLGVVLAAGGAGSTKARFEEMIVNLELAFASLNDYVGLLEDHSPANEAMQRLFTERLVEVRRALSGQVGAEGGTIAGRPSLLSNEGDDIIENVSDEQAWD